MIKGIPANGSLCNMLTPVECSYSSNRELCNMVIMPGTYFILLLAQEIPEYSCIECSILLDKCKMWFNIRPQDNIICNVRGVESYDIPFTTVAYT